MWWSSMYNPAGKLLHTTRTEEPVVGSSKWEKRACHGSSCHSVRSWTCSESPEPHNRFLHDRVKRLAPEGSSIQDACSLFPTMLLHKCMYFKFLFLCGCLALSYNELMDPFLPFPNLGYLGHAF